MVAEFNSRNLKKAVTVLAAATRGRDVNSNHDRCGTTIMRRTLPRLLRLMELRPGGAFGSRIPTVRSDTGRKLFSSKLTAEESNSFPVVSERKPRETETRAAGGSSEREGDTSAGYWAEDTINSYGKEPKTRVQRRVEKKRPPDAAPLY